MIFNRVLKSCGELEKTDVKWNLLRNLKKEYNIFRPAPRHYIKCISTTYHRFKITKVAMTVYCS
jgi:hypothetical protein